MDYIDDFDFSEEESFLEQNIFEDNEDYYEEDAASDALLGTGNYGFANGITGNIENPGKVYGGVRDVHDSIVDTFGTKGGQSIFQQVKNSILQFPIYISKSVDITSASLLTRYIEVYYAAIVQQAQSMSQYISQDQANNLQFLTHGHTNIAEKVDAVLSNEYRDYLRNPFYQPISKLDAMIENGFANDIPISENTTLMFRMLPNDDEEMNFESRKLASDALEGLSYLQEKRAPKDPDAPKPSIADTSKVGGIVDTPPRVYHNTTTTREDERSNSGKYEAIGNNPSEEDKIGMGYQYLTKVAGATDPTQADARASWNAARDAIIKNDPRMKDSGYKYFDGNFQKLIVTPSQKLKTSTRENIDIQRPTSAIEGPKPPMILKDNEVKKINAMAPYRMSITKRVNLPNGGVDRDITYIIGIKGILHAVECSDLDDELYGLVTGQSNNLQKVRYKTGEISLTDYLFDIKGLKKDATRSLNYNQKWITTLKQLANGNKLSGTLFQPAVDILQRGQVPIPNGTIILTDADVNYLKGTTGIDLNDIGRALALCRALFLISFIIITPASNTIKVLSPDLNKDWEYQSTKTLQDDINRAENNDLNKALQKLMNR